MADNPLTDSGLTDGELAHLRSRLDDDLAEARNLLSRLNVALDGIRTSREDAAADDEHDPEGPTMSAEWSHTVGVRADALRRVDAVEAALARFDAGRYGLCLRCGRPIGAGRLDARPEAELCIECAGR